MEVFSFGLMRFRNLSHMLSHYMCNYLTIYLHVYLVACSSMRAYLVGPEALDLFLSEPPSTCPAFLYVRSETTMDSRCVQTANALVRLCICLGSSELSTFA